MTRIMTLHCADNCISSERKNNTHLAAQTWLQLCKEKYLVTDARTAVLFYLKLH